MDNKKELNFESGNIIGNWNCQMTEQKILDILKHQANKNSSKKCENCKIKNTTYKWCEIFQIITNLTKCNINN